MKIVLNGEEKYYDFKDENLAEILNLIGENMEKEIIDEIYVNDVEVNLKYLTDSLIEADDIKSLKINTKKVTTLINNTLQEIDNYLPVLKNGCLDAADLFRNNDFEEANQKYQLILDGIDWYTGTITHIINLLDFENEKKDFENYIILLNDTLSEIINAYENKDNILVADILEYELTEIIENFIQKNEVIKNHISRE